MIIAKVKTRWMNKKVKIRKRKYCWLQFLRVWAFAQSKVRLVGLRWWCTWSDGRYEFCNDRWCEPCRTANEWTDTPHRLKWSTTCRNDNLEDHLFKGINWEPFIDDIVQETIRHPPFYMRKCSVGRHELNSTRILTTLSAQAVAKRSISLDFRY